MLHADHLGWGAQIMGLGLAAVFIMLLTLMAALMLLTHFDRNKPAVATAASVAALAPTQTMDERTMPAPSSPDQKPQPSDPKVASPEPFTDEEQDLINVAVAVHSVMLDAERLVRAGITDLDLATLAVATHLAVTGDTAQSGPQSRTGLPSNWLIRGRSAQTTSWHRR